MAGEAIRLLAKSAGQSIGEALESMSQRAEAAQERGDTVNAFWFLDLKWKRSPKPSSAEIGTYRPGSSIDTDVNVPRQESSRACDPAEAEAASRYWNQIVESLRSSLVPHTFRTWVAPIRPICVFGEVLHLALPSGEFIGADSRYRFAEHLPAGLKGIRCSFVEVEAA